jgi:hypothetical protein
MTWEREVCARRGSSLWGSGADAATVKLITDTEGTGTKYWAGY